MRGGDEDGVTTDAIHVDARAGLNVVQMDVAILGDQEHHAVLLTGLITHTYIYKSNVHRISQKFGMTLRTRTQHTEHTKIKSSLIKYERDGNGMN